MPGRREVASRTANKPAIAKAPFIYAKVWPIVGNVRTRREMQFCNSAGCMLMHGPGVTGILDAPAAAGTFPLTALPMTAECFGLAGLSRVLGIIVMSDAVAEASMPWLVARIRENSGSYAPGFALLTVVALLGALAIAAIKYRDGKPESRWQLGQ